MKEFETRIDMIRGLVGESGPVICEIGVFNGDFAKEMMRTIKPSKLILIDLFEGVCGSGDQDGNNFRKIDLNQSYIHLSQYFDSTCVSIIKGDSVYNLSRYPDGFFDLIYIDGDHSYEGCMRDLNIAMHKVKKNGWITGHDYEMNMNKAHIRYNFGVKQAVDEFCLKNNKSIYAKAYDGCVSYAIKNY